MSLMTASDPLGVEPRALLVDELEPAAAALPFVVVGFRFLVSELGPSISSCIGAEPLLPTERIIVADPVRSARAANADADPVGVSPAAIAAALRSFSILRSLRSVFLAPFVLP
ncbi:BZ3500_MvSof-1268-A1-R1_Chr3-1g05480 [Microbotryum saponariae]|uniref:BZ3500_MvSof-1268-A1-R1_Chr3-1g05480 protein n=1 Tax=Microbotryum saponariae TaxID=289078 RepID=A0A2X0LCT9_9BASI|nr:BZ3500_MvSof-1268-A1-R1_Chr3-1g05480 [Microbotryum saponariae]SDA04671.1 BZ3501_MvSof-1269-A2-R1_Chr3-1g05151 [Microbotryum saponariae]